MTQALAAISRSQAATSMLSEEIGQSFPNSLFRRRFLWMPLGEADNQCMIGIVINRVRSHVEAIAFADISRTWPTCRVTPSLSGLNRRSLAKVLLPTTVTDSPSLSCPFARGMKALFLTRLGTECVRSAGLTARAIVCWQATDCGVMPQKHVQAKHCQEPS